MTEWRTITGPNRPGDPCPTLRCDGVAKWQRPAEQARHGDAAPYRCARCVEEMNGLEDDDDAGWTPPRLAVWVAAAFAVLVLCGLLYGTVWAAVAMFGGGS